VAKPDEAKEEEEEEEEEAEEGAGGGSKGSKPQSALAPFTAKRFTASPLWMASTARRIA
jgi:hypothetical protein